MKIYDIKKYEYTKHIDEIRINVYINKTTKIYDNNHFQKMDKLTKNISDWHKEEFDIDISNIHNGYEHIRFIIPKQKQDILVALKLRFG